MRGLLVLERKDAIGPLIAGIPGLQVVTHMATEGETVFSAAVALGREGSWRSKLTHLIVRDAKRLGSRSTEGSVIVEIK